MRALRESGARAVPERFPLTIAFQNSLDTDIEIPDSTSRWNDIAPPVSRGDLSFGLAPRRDPAKGYRTFLEYSADLSGTPPRLRSCSTTGRPFSPNCALGRTRPSLYSSTLSSPSERRERPCPPHIDRSHSDDLLSFIRSSPSPYHVVAHAAQRLEKAGFQELRETDDWTAGAEGGRYVVRAGALLAWYVPAGAPARTPFPDRRSPHRLPEPADQARARHRLRGLAADRRGDAGGVPHNTWLDRDLGISGRLTLRDGSSRLVCVDQPLLRVPQLAIHLDRGVNEGVVLDAQQHMTPLWGLGPTRPGALLARVAAEADTDVAEVLGWDLMLHDIQPPGYLGADQEFLVSPRLDNQISVHAGVTALVCAATAARPPAPHPGAGRLRRRGRRRLPVGRPRAPCWSGCSAGPSPRGGSAQDFDRALAGAFCVSADMSHAVHPNYAERHDPDHHPLPNGGPVVKVNVNQRYATDGTGVAAFAAACERAEVPWQPFVSHNAMPCGTSIGPITRGPAGSRHRRRGRTGAVDALRAGAVRGAGPRPAGPGPHRVRHHGLSPGPFVSGTETRERCQQWKRPTSSVCPSPGRARPSSSRHGRTAGLRVLRVQLPAVRSGSWRRPARTRCGRPPRRTPRRPGSSPEGARVAVFGHSLGAVLGFELAHRLEAEPGVRLDALVVSGAPDRVDRPRGPCERSARRGVPGPGAHLAGYAHPALEHPEMRELLLPLLRADVRIARRTGPPPTARSPPRSSPCAAATTSW